MHPNLVIRDQITPLLLAKDMDNKLQEGHNHIRWHKIHNGRWSLGNYLDIVVLPQNPLWKVTTHPLFVGHNSSGVPAYILKRRYVSSSLVRTPDDMSMLHRINCGSEVSNIRKAHGRFPSTHKQVSTIIIFIRPPRNELPKVIQNSSLQTQRNKFISSQV